MKPDPTRHPLAVTLPLVRFPVTICVLAYGPHAALAERFLDSLYRHTDPRLFWLRAGLNEAEPATHKLFQDFAGRFENITIFAEPNNIFKSAMMRRLFHEAPLSTAWTIWCDDDTHFTRPDWLHRLALSIERSPEVAMWGKLYGLWWYDRVVLDWIKAAAWYRGLPFLYGTDADGNEATHFSFVTGAFWAIRTDVLRMLDWPDFRLVHANDDFLLGEALRQNQLLAGYYKYGVRINDEPRRNSNATEVRHLQMP